MNKRLLINRAKSVKDLSSIYFTVTVAVYITKILMLKKRHKNFKGPSANKLFISTDFLLLNGTQSYLKTVEPNCYQHLGFPTKGLKTWDLWVLLKTLQYYFECTDSNLRTVETDSQCKHHCVSRHSDWIHQHMHWRCHRTPPHTPAKSHHTNQRFKKQQETAYCIASSPQSVTIDSR